MKNTMYKAGRILIYALLVHCFCVGILIDLGAPYATRYLADVMNICLLACVLFTKDKRPLLKAKYVLAAMAAWLAYMLISTLFKQPSLLRIAWALRNWGRGFVLFCGCFLFLKGGDIKKLLNLMRGVYIVNFFLVCVEFFLFDLDGDFLGGLFGSALGCNGQTLILMVIVLTETLARDFEQGKATPFTFFVLVTSMVIAALEEIKFFYYVYIGIVLLVSLAFSVMNKPNWRLLLIVFTTTIVSFALGMWILYLVHPKHFLFVTHQRSYLSYEEGSRVSYKISRSRFISEINELFFHGSIPLNLTGYGFGNCDYSKFDFLTSDFYRANGDMNYLFFSHQPLFLEGGFLGMLFFLLIPGISILECFRAILRERKAKTISVFGMLFCIFLGVNFFYNNTFRTDISYLIYFGLALYDLFTKTDKPVTISEGS